MTTLACTPSENPVRPAVARRAVPNLLALIPTLLRSFLRLRRKHIGVPCYHCVNQGFTGGPEPARGLKLRPKPAPAPPLALVSPEVQTLTTQLVEDEADMANERVANQGSIGGTQRHT